MTSNERKIINFLRDAKEKTHIRLIAKKINFSSDYTQSLCHSLARAGYVKLEDSDVCHLLKKGQGHFESIAVMREVSEPVVATANVTLLTDEPAVVSPASNRNDEEENQEEGASENKDKDESASSDEIENPRQSRDSDEELDRALSDLEPSSQKDESEEKDKPEEPKDETENESRELEEQKTEEIAEELKEEIDMDRKKDALNKEILVGTEATEEEKVEKPDETELKPESRAEEEKPAVAEAVASKEKELPEEAKAENPEKVALKEEPVQPSGGFGASFKKIVPIAKLSRILDKVGINWFAEKK